jgi:hypothetical protein
VLTVGVLVSGVGLGVASAWNALTGAAHIQASAARHTKLKSIRRNIATA